MENLERDFKRYFKETLDIAVNLEQWEEKKRLPFFLRSGKEFKISMALYYSPWQNQMPANWKSGVIHRQYLLKKV